MENAETKLPEPLLRATDVAIILNISRAYAYRLMKQGVICSVSIGSSRRVRLKDLITFIDASLSPSPEAMIR